MGTALTVAVVVKTESVVDSAVVVMDSSPGGMAVEEEIAVAWEATWVKAEGTAESPAVEECWAQWAQKVAGRRVARTRILRCPSQNKEDWCTRDIPGRLLCAIARNCTESPCFPRAVRENIPSN